MNIIIDTREKHPWMFDFTTSTVVFRKLDTGDYSLDEMEDIICIERKKSVVEIANNITDSRFKRELERMQQFRYKFLICEFDYGHIYDFPQGAGLPKKVEAKIRVKGKYIIKCLSRIMAKYGISVITCPHKIYAENVAHSIMKEIYEIEKESQ